MRSLNPASIQACCYPAYLRERCNTGSFCLTVLADGSTSGLTQKRQELLTVLVIGAVVDVMFTHHADAFLKPDIFSSAAAEMVRKNVNGVPILRWQERGYALAGRLDAPRNIAVSPLSACLQWETEIG